MLKPRKMERKKKGKNINILVEQFVYLTHLSIEHQTIPSPYNYLLVEERKRD